MESKLKILVLIYALMISLAHGGNEVGNGGDVIVCEDNNVMLLDYHEAKEYGFDINLTKDSVGYRSILLDIISKFKKVDPKLADQYLKRINEIDIEINFKESVDLVDIPDSHHVSLPKNCELKQIAIRLKEKRNGKQFVIDKDLWGKLDVRHQAGLILHEIIYEHFLFLGEKNSKKARYMNALISHIGSGNKLKTSYKELLRDREIPIYR